MATEGGDRTFSGTKMFHKIDDASAARSQKNPLGSMADGHKLVPQESERPRQASQSWGTETTTDRQGPTQGSMQATHVTRATGRYWSAEDGPVYNDGRAMA